MAYTKAQMNELARAHLARLTQKELGAIILDVLYTSALDLYARLFKAFHHRDTWNGDGATYDTALPEDLISSISMRVGTGPTASTDEVQNDQWLDAYESSLGLPSPPYYIYTIEDAQKYIRVYPAVPDGTAVQHWIKYIPAAPATDGAYFPPELELHPFLRALRWAYWELEDQVEKADVIKQELYIMALDVIRRNKERSKEIHRRPTIRQLG